MKNLGLDKIIEEKVSEWRKNNYKSDVSELAEILKFQKDDEGIFRFLRKAQLEAIETYFYLRVVEKTPHAFDLYQKYFEPKELRKLFGIETNDEVLEIIEDGGQKMLFEKIKTDAKFVKKYSLETVSEMISLDYPSYILALAMGAGKTTLIGSIMAIEFALAIATQNELFMKNALVFAPGTTIFKSLREIQSIPFQKILPPRFCKHFLQNIKFVIASEAKNLPIIEGNNFYAIITNTEKIRIQKNGIRRNPNQTSLQLEKLEERVEAEANLRLQAIGKLKNLGIFSDEAHHLAGNELNKDLKRVRQTVNFLADETNVVVVVNTTGTPYFGKQMLKEVVYWYSLSEGIEDGILKSVENSIRGYSKVNDETFLKEVLTDFFKEYGNVKIGNGASAKIAIYFPKVEDLKKARKLVELILKEIGEDPSIVIENHSKSDKENMDASERFHLPESPHRVILLVAMKTEGWDCPPLFACALAREISTSNNLVLQSSTRCLRQIKGNNKPARIYLSERNLKTLDSQLQKTFGETLEHISKIKPIKETKIFFRKTEIEPIEFDIERMLVEEKAGFKLENIEINLKKFKRDEEEFETIIADAIKDQEGRGKISSKDRRSGKIEKSRFNARETTAELSRNYDLDFFKLLKEVDKIHNGTDFTETEIETIASQVEQCLGERFEIKIKRETISCALFKKEGFDFDEKTKQYYAEIRYSRDEMLSEHKGEKLGFHYTPYNFDSSDEKEFFEWLLEKIGESAKTIEDIYFMGAITTPEKTDFWFWYRGVDEAWHRYTPDFLIRRKDGKIFIIEIKPADNEQKDATTQRKAEKLRRIAKINPNKFKYEIVEGFERFIETPIIKSISEFIKP